ncbi:cupin domain-containing protein [Streptosporangium sp. NPDC023615]|uniref:cupin domain-containing protein n=1 Tax=Streptosporangium sp. NPDC023615 TaxID=3154794 RepID=UPI00342FC504
MTTQDIRIVDLDEVPGNTKRGGDLRVLLSSKTVGATSGYMGVAVLKPGERVNEHYHPYSEEYLYVTTGAVTIDLDGVPHAFGEGQALLVPINVRHRVRNTGDAEARIAFFLTPLAPRPELGHVDTEEGPGD